MPSRQVPVVVKVRERLLADLAAVSQDILVRDASVDVQKAAAYWQRIHLLNRRNAESDTDDRFDEVRVLLRRVHYDEEWGWGRFRLGLFLRFVWLWLKTAPGLLLEDHEDAVWYDRGFWVAMLQVEIGRQLRWARSRSFYALAKFKPFLWSWAVWQLAKQGRLARLWGNDPIYRKQRRIMLPNRYHWAPGIAFMPPGTPGPLAEVGTLEETTTTADPGTAGTSLAVTSRTAFPQSGNFYIVVQASETDKTNREIMLVTGGWGSGAGSFTVTRAQEGTTGVTHVSGSYVAQTLVRTGLINMIEERLAVFNVRTAYGAKGDGVTMLGGITTGTNTFTSTTAVFVATDVGKTISVTGAGAAGAKLVTTIAGFTSTTVVTLTANAGTTVTGAASEFATDDTTAFQNAINAASSAHGTAVIPPAVAWYMVGSTTIPDTGNVRVMGLGHLNGTTLKKKSGDLYPMFYRAQSLSQIDSVCIENVTMLGQGINVDVGTPSPTNMGVWIHYATNVTVKSCTVTDFADAGIQAYSSSQVKFTDNIVRRCCQVNGQNHINLALNPIQTAANLLTESWITGNLTDTGPQGAIIVSPSNSTTADGSQNCFILANIAKNCDWCGIGIEADHNQFFVISKNQSYHCREGYELGRPQTRFPGAPGDTYITVEGNLHDSQLYTYGSTNQGIVITGHHIVVKGNVTRCSGSNGIGGSQGGTGEGLDDVSVEGNFVTTVNADSTQRPTGISLQFCTASRITGNLTTRLNARVIGAQTPGAGGLLTVDAVEGWPTAGNFLSNGTVYAYTAITQAVAATSAKVTMTAGGTFADGQKIYPGGSGLGIFLTNACKDTSIRDNTIRNHGTAGVRASGSTRVEIADNVVVDSGTQADGGALDVGMYIDGTGVSNSIVNNRVYSTGGTQRAPSIGFQITAGQTLLAMKDNYVDGIATPYNLGSTPTYFKGNRKNSGHLPDSQTARVTTDVTLAGTGAQNVTGLSFTIDKSESWDFEATLFIHNAAANTGGVTVTVTVPAGATLKAQAFGNSTSAVLYKNLPITAGTLTAAFMVYASTTVGGAFITISGTVVNSTTAGTVQIQAAEGTAADVNTVEANSKLVANQIGF